MAMWYYFLNADCSKVLGEGLFASKEEAMEYAEQIGASKFYAEMG